MAKNMVRLRTSIESDPEDLPLTKGVFQGAFLPQSSASPGGSNPTPLDHAMAEW